MKAFEIYYNDGFEKVRSVVAVGNTQNKDYGYNS